MLIRLFLFVLIFGVGGFVAYRFKNARSLSGKGGLDVFEIERLMKLASGSERIRTAMMLRVNIVETAPTDDKKSVSFKVDGALRRLASLEVLRKRVQKTLAGADRAKIAEEVAKAQAGAETAEANRVDGKQKLVEQLETQLEQLKQLHLREDELDEAGHRLMLEMNNLQLALLNASSAEASAATGAVASALDQLEETAEGVRQKTSANQEVERLLKAAAASRQLNG